MEEKWCIWIKGTEVYVNEEVFRAYIQSAWREDNHKKASINKECSYDFMCENDYDGMADVSHKSVEDIIVDKLSSERLHKALECLTKDEYLLIEALYFNGKNELQFALETGVSQQAVNKKKNRIIKKLKNILINF